MFINKKLYMKLIFYLTGTALVLFLFGTVFANVFRDSLLFASSGTGNETGESGAAVATKVLFPTDNAKVTLPPPTPPPMATSSGKLTATPKKSSLKTATPPIFMTDEPTTTGEPTAAPTEEPTAPPTLPPLLGIKIEVINRSGNTFAGIYIKDMLASRGYEASLVTDTGDLQAETVIIMRTSNMEEEALYLRDFINIGTIIYDVIEGYAYDFTIIIGSAEAP